MSFLDLFTAWSITPLALAAPLVGAVVYLFGVVALRRRGESWSRWRTLWWMLGCAIALWTLAGAPWVFRARNDWMDGVALGMASAVLPLCAALGDPIHLIEQLRGRRLRMMRGRIARALMYPGVSSVISMLFLTIALTSHWYSPQGRTPVLLWQLLLLCTFLTGLLVNLPLFGDELLPSWATPVVKTVIAFLDGLFDAIPGIVMMLLINLFAGGALLAVAEIIGIPMIAATLVQWGRTDAETTREVDAALDAEEPGDGLWWQSDPRFQERFGGPRGTQGPR